MQSLVSGSLLQGGKYRIERVLGQGSFGITYLATTKLTMMGELGRMETTVNVAIKEFFMRDINGRTGTNVTSGSNGGIYDDYKRKFKREALNLSTLQHPNIIKVIESFEANNTVYYVMEYIDGGSLDDYILKEDGLKEDEAKMIALQIGSALSYMHSRGMLHLDLKPSNIMRKKSGEIVLIDFGLSKQYTDNGEPESSTSLGLGTPGYAPIEQANYREGNGFPVTMDVYALGATFFKMLSGNRPQHASEVFEEGLDIVALTKKGVSRSTINAVQKAMAPTKKNRYQTVCEFLSALNISITDNKKSQTREKRSKTTYTEDTDQNEETDNFSDNIYSTKKIKLDKEKISPKPNNNRSRESSFFNFGKISAQCKASKKWWILFTLSVMAVILIFVFSKYNTNSDKPVISADTPNPEVIDSISQNMVLVKGGSFGMGRNSGFDWDRKHKVTLSNYYIGKTEVTQSQWKAVMGSNPSHFKGDNLPVENVTWANVHAFIEKLNKITGKNFRLPTEAEWEYAAIGGEQSEGYLFSGSNSIGDVAWYKQNSGSTTHPVGTKLPNNLGIYDMTGNVSEWCSDLYLTYPSEAQVNPKGGINDHVEVRHIIRGGGWNDTDFTCEVSNRTGGGNNSKRKNSLGLRLAMDADSGEIISSSPSPAYDESAYDGILNGYKWIDLGLPSGIKWATANVGASSPRSVGKYYAWGEIKVRKSYTENNEIYYSYKDLTTSHDIATKVMGSGWRMPTKKELEELIDNCKCVNLENGVVLVGRNGHELFLPFSGVKYGETVNSETETCYWASTPVISDDEIFKESIATTLQVFYDEIKVNQLAVFHGLNVRGVTK